MTRLRRIGPALLLAVFLASPAGAGSLRVRHLSPAEGLPNGRTWASAQDRDGYVWIASSSGVTRYDGQRFHTLTVGDGLPHNTVLSVVGDREEGVWAGTAGGLAHVVDGEVVRVVGEADGMRSEVVRALQWSEDRLWIGTEVGVFRLDSDGPVAVRPEDDRDLRVRSLALRSSGGVWAGTMDGVWEVRGDRLVPVESPERLSDAIVFGVLEVGADLWVGSSDGLWRRRARGEWRRWGRDDGLPVDQFNRLARARDGRLWVGTWGAGLFRVGPDGFDHWGRDRGFPLSFITSLFEDSEGNLWASSHQAGAAVLVEHAFETLGPEDGVPPLVTRMQVDDQGNVWLGSIGGLSFLPRGDAERVRSVPLLHPQVVNLVLDDRGRGWIGTRSGVALVDGEDVRWWGLDEIGGSSRIEDLEAWEDRCFVLTDRSVALLSADGIEAILDRALGASVFATRATRDGTLWVASVRGISRWKPGTEPRTFDESTGLPSAEVRSLWVEDDRLWAGTHEGLVQLSLEGEVLRHWTREDGLPDDHVTQMLVAQDGAMWVGTEKGAAVVRGDRLRAFPAGPGFLGSQVTVFSPEPDGSMWVGSDLGLNLCTPEACRPWGAEQGMEQQPVYQVLRTSPQALWIVTSMGVHYWTGDDLAFFPCRGDLGVRSITRNTAAADRLGRLWVGTDGGVVRFDAPGDDRERQLPLHLLDIRIDGRPFDRSVLDAPLPPGTSAIELGFVALSFRDPEHVRYEVRWEGPEGERRTRRSWEKSTLLTGLEPGEHKVVVDARDVGGARAAVPLTLSFTIARPLWERAWFRALALVLSVLGFVAVVRLRTLGLVRRQEQLERLVRERTAALDEANAKLARLATHDELTGLPNHRYFWERARQMRSRARRRGEAFALVIVDLDDFKAVNDRWGHQVGDEVLRQAANALRGETRDEDLVARYGGEEFAALLVGGDVDVAVRVAERMRSSLEVALVTTSGGDEVRVTGSFGVGTWNLEDDSLRDLFRRADRAVYRAKGEGKNRVAIQAARSGPPVPDDTEEISRG